MVLPKKQVFWGNKTQLGFNQAVPYNPFLRKKRDCIGQLLEWINDGNVVISKKQSISVDITFVISQGFAPCLTQFSVFTDILV